MKNKTPDRATAARLATGKAGGVPLPLLSKSRRESLKRQERIAPAEPVHHTETGAAARRLRQRIAREMREAEELNKLHHTPQCQLCGLLHHDWQDCER